jgi:hypothetical protein
MVVKLFPPIGVGLKMNFRAVLVVWSYFVECMMKILQATVKLIKHTIDFSGTKRCIVIFL